ncbi:putative zinc finger protein [Trypanosoma cruzi]|uniref:Zinc-finger protein, putative n=2 Tax=Trypanosoma cruzi TaxID=5693 RepID=Q4DT67_TRYCC|nr:zinc-finger protein, putative [Trypanosoma cruzi]EAN95733.1 zinc-finger protein, putative [Trypanosoma cruzi]PWU96891.1 putative zinc finger protein [Trypanosoma cruzi]PWV15667.1 putative zinc finger protein [Trypanosoma cruzi]RNC43473.1 putative zinc finger protein [Trypanosoma cruzi]|eukprot:XP_817584.1 zinc-finger protein [Trypanosoma cruzi strain CL Brener]
MATDTDGRIEEPRGVTCGLCFNVLKLPLTFDCRHSYCTDCVRAKLESQNSDGFACPLCNVLYAAVSARNLQSFSDARLASHVKMIAEGTDGAPMCQWCEEVPAAVQCHECMFVYCNDCNTAVHKSAAKRGHVTAKIGSQQKLRGMQKKCLVRGHEEYRAEFYCSQCEEMCCAYCLQVGPHKNHENMGAARAAADIRQQLSRDMGLITQKKTVLESQASELNRVTAQYFNSYDSVENIITERFNHFKQQLMQREVELRKLLATLRESGDTSLTSTRKLFLAKLNALNEATLRFQHLRSGGSDHEVLESRSILYSFLKTETPTVTGSGFKVSNLGDMMISGLELHLDLQTMHGVELHNTDSTERRPNNGPPSGGMTTRQPSEATNGNRNFVGGSTLPPERPLRLTFPVDDDVEATLKGDGVLLRCVARGGGGSTQIGVRSRELMETVGTLFPEDGGCVTWRIRLELITESFVGVVEKTDAAAIPEGFYWCPTKSGVVDGHIGRPTPIVQQLPVCRNGDVLRFTYDIRERTLRFGLNGSDRGVILTELHPRVAACFIFYPGEALTVLP